MAAIKYKAKNSWSGVIPFWVNDVIGSNSYNELQRGNSVTLSEIKDKGILEFLTKIEVSESTSDEE